jgi:hypothetical protein
LSLYTSDRTASEVSLYTSDGTASEVSEMKNPPTADETRPHCRLLTLKVTEPFSRISAPICFPRISYPFLDRFFHLHHADFNGEHLSYLKKTNWPNTQGNVAWHDIDWFVCAGDDECCRSTHCWESGQSPTARRLAAEVSDFFSITKWF